MPTQLPKLTSVLVAVMTVQAGPPPALQLAMRQLEVRAVVVVRNARRACVH